MATIYDQIIGTWTDTTPQVRVIADAISLIDPMDIALLDYLGGLDAARSKFKIGGNGVKIEILEDEYEPLSGVCAGATGLTNDTTLTNWTVADASIFQDGHVIMMDAEYCIVKAADTSANTITVYSRSYGGTNATHAIDEAITIVGMARLQGDDADYGGIVDISAPYNYTSIFQSALKVTGTEQAIDQYGMADKFAYQAAKKLPAKLRLVNRMLYYGVRAGAASASAPSSAGGMGTFIGSNTVAAGGAISKADVDGLAEQCYMDGGYPDVLVCNPAVAGDLKGLIDSSSFVRLGQENTQLGMSPLKSLVTQYGQMNLLMDRHCPVAKAFMLTSQKAGVYTLRPFGWKPLAVTGDSTKGELVGEFSFMMANDLAHGTITGITS